MGRVQIVLWNSNKRAQKRLINSLEKTINVYKSIELAEENNKLITARLSIDWAEDDEVKSNSSGKSFNTIYIYIYISLINIYIYNKSENYIKIN